MKVLELKSVDEKDKNENMYLDMSNIFVRIFDYGKVEILRKIYLSETAFIWKWCSFVGDIKIEGHIKDSKDSFDVLINEAVCNIYCTVYEFSRLEEFIINIENVKYIEKVAQYIGR